MKIAKQHQHRIIPMLLILITLCNSFLSHINAFTTIQPLSNAKRAGPYHATTALNSNKVASLTPETTWRLRFSLNSVPTKNGRKVGDLFNVDVQFVEDEGFEPPQGAIIQILPSDSEEVPYLKVKSGRWQLSEDPEDKKDGLWIWGLFKEPQYPFMLLSIETLEYNLPGEEKDAINPLTLYAQINHKRDKDNGNVELDAATLNIREIESIKADPFGAAKVEVYEEVKCGQISLRPLDVNPVLK